MGAALGHVIGTHRLDCAVDSSELGSGTVGKTASEPAMPVPFTDFTVRLDAAYWRGFNAKDKRGARDRNANGGQGDFNCLESEGRCPACAPTNQMGEPLSARGCV